MNRDRWRRIEAVFHRALEVDLQERSDWLAAECGSDTNLRERVELLLRDDAASCRFLDDWTERLPTTPRDPWIGRELGVYRLTSKIAAGGMGVVYQGERTDGLFDQEVAVKLIRTEAASEDVLRRFEFERRTLASLTHENIARLYDGGTTDDGSPYIVMEFIHGSTIDQYCKEEKLDVASRLGLFVSVCKAVHHAHHNLIVHRDLKPGNILVDGAGVPKLLDFGIARLVDPDEGQGLEPTRTFARVLTPEYSSPEQLTGGAVTTATDVYSLGVVLYELLTGKRPFHCGSRSPADWERVLTTHAPTRPSSAVVRGQEHASEGPVRPGSDVFAASCGTTPGKLRRRLVGDLDRIILMALRKEPDRRYDSALQFAEDIERHIAGRPVLARQDSIAYRTSKFVRRNGLTVASTVIVLAALLFALITSLIGEQRAKREAVHAQIEADSSRSIADFLTDTFLMSEMFVGAEAREGARSRIVQQGERVRRQYADQVHLRANLLDALGRTCLLLDLFADAETFIQEALALRRAEFGEQSLEVALSLASLGELQYRRGEYAAAVDSLRASLDLHRTCPSAAHTNVALAANNLAAALRNIGATEEAERLHMEALEIRREAGARTPPVAESLNNLAGVHLDRDEPLRAALEFEEALEIRRSILGPEHALTLQTLSNLANAHYLTGGTAKARALLQDAAEGFRSLKAEGRAGLGRTLSNLGALELASDRLTVAAEYLEEAYMIQSGRLGDHPLVASILTNTATLERKQGDTEAARASWEEALRILRSNGPASHPQLSWLLQAYGVFLSETGSETQAEQVLAESIAILESASSPDHSALGRARLSLGGHLMRQRDFARAVAELRLGLGLLDGVDDLQEGELEMWRRDLAQALAALGQAAH